MNKINMATRYLLHFVHEHTSFRWTEFLALTSKNGCKFRMISEQKHTQSRPYIIIELEEDGTDAANRLIRSAKESYLIMGLYELWAQSNISIDHLDLTANKSPQFLSGLYSKPDQTFRVNCESFGAKLSQDTKVDWIRRMTFMDSFQCRPNLKEPRQVYCIFEMNERQPGEPCTKEYYFGRLLTIGNRAVVHDLSLKSRIFIANTSMDPMLSLIAANTAKVKPGDIVYDPFVGSGSLLVAAAYMGAYVLGADIDWLLLHGKSRPSRIGQDARQEGESVRANLRQYKLEDRYLDVMVSDITRSPLSEKLIVDSIISDPPYGIRECSRKIGDKERRPAKDYKVRFPSKTAYNMQELFGDLLLLSVKHLSIGGRLVYYLPVTKNDLGYEEFIPRHPCLNLISHCEQALTGKTARLMVVMEKTRDPRSDDMVEVPQIINDMNFRETYFSKSDYNK